ncbi:MAG: hypothetical protein JO361_07255 [Gammaproteobacteria bacterium]|nr:hypothetical protein [Gammaproteobacteria bacterium]
MAKVAQLKRKGRRVTLLKNALFVFILLVIVAMCVSDQALEENRVAAGISLKSLVTFVEGLLALLLGAWQLHDNHKASRELLLQYRNQGAHFARARRQLSRHVVGKHHDHVLVELGRDSLMESYLWAIHGYHRQHEPAGKH